MKKLPEKSKLKISLPIIFKISEIRSSRTSRDYQICIIWTIDNKDHLQSTFEKSFNSYEQADLFIEGMKNGAEWIIKFIKQSIIESQKYTEKNKTNSINVENIINFLEDYKI